MTLLDRLPETAVNHRRRIALLVNQGEVMILLFKSQEYYDLLIRHEPLAVSVGDSGLFGAFYGRLGWCAYTFGAFDQATPILTKAAELCKDTGNAADAGLAYMVLQWIHFWQGNYDRVLTVKEEVLRTMAQRFHLRWYMWALSVTAWAYTALGCWQEAVADGQQASRVGEEFADPSTIAYAATTLAVLILPQVTWGGHAHMGSWQSRKLLGEGYWRVGESDEAIQTLAELLELAERCGVQFYLGAAHRLLGEIALTTNPMQVEAPLAAPHFEQSIAVLRAIKAENELALAYAGYGRLHRQQGNITLAREYLTQALEIFERLGTLGEPDKVRQALAELPRR